MHLIHPVVRIAGLFVLAVLVQLLPVTALVASAVLTLVAYACYRPVCRTTLRRSRWLLVTLLLIYSLSTRGIRSRVADLAFAHLRGVDGRGRQTPRLLSMLAGRCYWKYATEDLMAAIYQLLRPLRRLESVRNAFQRACG